MRIEHIHFYVEDAKTWRNWFVNILGFEVVENYILPPFPLNNTQKQEFHTLTEVVKSNSICFVISSPLLPTSPVAEFLHRHPPGVVDVAFIIEDMEEVMMRVESHGTEVLQPICEYQQNGMYFKSCQIKAWGSLTHTLIEVREIDNRGHKDMGIFSLGISPSFPHLTSIDHIVLNVPAGDLDKAVVWYEKILDLQPQQIFNIQTEFSALHSRVMTSRNGKVQLPINQPITRNSQIQEFLDFNQGAGIQHIALRSPNLVNTIANFRDRGLSFLSIPETYYLQLVKRPGFSLSNPEIKAIAQQQILVDWQEQEPDALLLQIFTQPIFGKPTFFFEFIERRHLAQGFGEGNFRALFEAIESEQMKRGSLH
ncbi:4-hydroxyphenylpyruvate dioxygenase [Calothrix sp. UHCC 0171]|uniref:4-hydroxyphenylpyruvate dioxygenase n=1 Tax=Calothrix sp. UHCC 0171 TaxID=3110245 RepID=UPI002B217A61|nr:4-hydroxyphenylpyruvate dioxygenase [Calothrix sp. UHCC 0171]MEA5571349.1 4-hydroxyphenylpyruvate dioxygenase [Calothrix sp. UHCC 0171]